MEAEKIVSWKKVGDEKTHCTKRDKTITVQDFINPVTGETQEFVRYQQPDWSMIFPITENGQVITCWQYYQGVDSIINHLPGGNADSKQEKPEEVARRELLEETGYEAEEMIFVGRGPLSTRNSTTICNYFLALNCKKVKKRPFDENEPIKQEIIPLKEWILRVFQGTGGWPTAETTFQSLPYLKQRFPELCVDDILQESYQAIMNRS